MTIKKMSWDDCGGCPYFYNIIYCETYDDFNSEERDAEKLTEDMYCNFHLWPIKVTEDEYEKIPHWCPLEDEGKFFRKTILNFFKWI